MGPEIENSILWDGESVEGYCTLHPKCLYGEAQESRRYNGISNPRVSP